MCVCVGGGGGGGGSPEIMIIPPNRGICYDISLIIRNYGQPTYDR